MRSSVKLECRHCLQLLYDAHSPPCSFSSAFVHFVPFCKQSQNEYLIVSVVDTESLAKHTILVSVRSVVYRDLFSRALPKALDVNKQTNKQTNKKPKKQNNSRLTVAS